MGDKSLGIFLMVLFGMGGIIILIVAWAQPMPASERILTTFVGSIGIIWTLIRALLLMSAPAKVDVKKGLAEVEVEKKPY